MRLCPEHAQQLTYQKREQQRRALDAAAVKGSRKRRRSESQPAAEKAQRSEGGPIGGQASAAGDGLDAALDGLFP